MSHNEYAGQLKTMQVICGSLVAGVTMFLIMTLVIRGIGEDSLIVRTEMLNFASVLVIISVFLALVALLAYYTLPVLVTTTRREALASSQHDQTMRNNGDSRTRRPDLVAIYQTQMSVGLAILEGAAFVNLIVFLLEGTALNLVVTAALIAFMATRFPTHGSLENWLDDQSRLLQDGNESVRSE